MEDSDLLQTLLIILYHLETFIFIVAHQKSIWLKTQSVNSSLIERAPLSPWKLSKSLQITNIGKDVEKREHLKQYVGFPNSSVGKESACNTGDPSSIPGMRTSAGEGIGHPLQYSWASLVAQLVKNPPAMQETWVWSLGWEEPLEKGKATHSSILAWGIPWTVWYMRSQRVGHDWATFTFNTVCGIAEKNKYHICTQIVWNLEKQFRGTCLQVRNGDADVRNGHVDRGRGGDGERGVEELGV